MSSSGKEHSKPHSPHVAHHFHSATQQYDSAVLGMWLFLATEILLFSGMFCVYAVYRANHPDIFEYAHKYLSVPLGAINTAVLLCSSFTMATAVWAAQTSRRRLLVIMLAATILGGCGFMGIKYVEYKHKWEEGLRWGKYYQPKHTSDDHEAPAEGHPTDHVTPVESAPAASTAPAESQPTDPGWVFQPADLGPRGLLRPPTQPDTHETPKPLRNVHLFFSVYFGMTGLHGLHVLAGLIVIAWILVRSAKGHFDATYNTPVHMVGLYWHVVDLIWIYLFPLLYLIH